MATENKSKPGKANKSKKGKHCYLPHNKPVKKGSWPLRPGVQGFFITCDGGRERQASREAINVIDSFYEELVLGRDSKDMYTKSPNKPLNKKIKFTHSDSSSSSDEDDDCQNDGEDIAEKDDREEKDKQGTDGDSNVNHENVTNGKFPCKENGVRCENQETGNMDNYKEGKNDETQEGEAEEPPAKKQCLEADVLQCENVINAKIEKSIDKLIEAELAELGDRNKRRFSCLDSGCNGVVFVQMRKRDGDPCPKDIVQRMMTSVSSTKKHVSRFVLRVLPVELTCYASEEEIAGAIKPLIAQYFTMETQMPKRFAVLFEVRANTGIDRMKIINTVAKSVPAPHKVDLSSPDMSIVVQIVKTVCLIGVVEKYKELAKYNLRQLSSSKL